MVGETEATQRHQENGAAGPWPFVGALAAGAVARLVMAHRRAAREHHAPGASPAVNPAGPDHPPGRAVPDDLTPPADPPAGTGSGRPAAPDPLSAADHVRVEELRGRRAAAGHDPDAAEDHYLRAAESRIRLLPDDPDDSALERIADDFSRAAWQALAAHRPESAAHSAAAALESIQEALRRLGPADGTWAGRRRNAYLDAEWRLRQLTGACARERGLATGDPRFLAAAEQAYRTAYDQAVATGRLAAAGLSLEDRGRIAFLREDTDGAERLLGRAVEIAQSEGRPVHEISALTALASVAYRRQDPDTAAARCRQVFTVAQESRDRIDEELAGAVLDGQARCALLLGVIAAADDDPERAERWLEESLDLFARAGTAAEDEGLRSARAALRALREPADDEKGDRDD